MDLPEFCRCYFQLVSLFCRAFRPLKQQTMCSMASWDWWKTCSFWHALSSSPHLVDITEQQEPIGFFQVLLCISQIPFPHAECIILISKKNKYIYKQRIENEIVFYIDRNILQLNLKCWIRDGGEMGGNQLNRPFFPVLRSLSTQLRCTWRTALTLHTGRNSPEGPKLRSERCRTLLPGAPRHLICAQTRSKITMSNMAFLAHNYSEKFFKRSLKTPQQEIFDFGFLRNRK